MKSYVSFWIQLGVRHWVSGPPSVTLRDVERIRSNLLEMSVLRGKSPLHVGWSKSDDLYERDQLSEAGTLLVRGLLC
jgi:hypothetical protein